MNEVYVELIDERIAQDKKWGEQNHSPQYWMVILMEEVGEACKELCGKTQDYKKYREEMVQVAAVAIAAIESYDRQSHKERTPPQSMAKGER